MEFNWKGFNVDVKFLLGFVTGVVASIIYNLDKQKTKQILTQKTTLLGIGQVVAGFVLTYTGHAEIGGGLITSGFACIIYQPRDAKENKDK